MSIENEALQKAADRGPKQQQPLDEDENYRDSEDEDYKAGDEVNYDSESDGDSSDDDYEKESSSDRSKPRKKKNTKNSKQTSKPSDEDDAINYEKYSGIQGEGLIKTRAQRLAEESKAKEFENSQAVDASFDVKSVWEAMKNDALGALESRRNSSPAKSESPESPSIDASDRPATAPTGPTSQLADEYIIIKRVYSFAGKVTEEEVRVHKLSAEAAAYLKEQEYDNEKKVSDTTATSSKRKNSVSAPKRRGPVKRKQGSLMDELNSLRPKKINTLEKSRMDWLGYVDKSGIKDELSLHNKDGYLQKQDFLSRVDNRLENEIKSHRSK